MLLLFLNPKLFIVLKYMYVYIIVFSIHKNDCAKSIIVIQLIWQMYITIIINYLSMYQQYVFFLIMIFKMCTVWNLE